MPNAKCEKLKAGGNKLEVKKKKSQKIVHKFCVTGLNSSLGK